ncbi:NAD-dependent epimerase/dehydratase family protein [Streptomyces albireticuli]|uniref:Short-chain dehydrogenase n=1 Tax=Streptomyces albireticuli TaxID=1940 RepID=A0A2A2DFU3_9ACTN|nr:NAD(P)-dependent oxidoreductase [Streptomyces albireticuli]MCD9143662.1 NAD(P)-dependent oxidoreductase [Streptomyces albireticuli]MCD9161907.1 NAD(P)-dependent oxidoreductase [Streptomyces albireticuli]MCD9191779.1 NAD(P)-dependent oxidoreductase [Streptomyces albireticuli]PAU50142.1 short-chain dehydrogenase [Streptomyces albireticuli]
MRRVLVLGGTGFLGAHLVDAFTATGAEVLSASRGGPLSVDLTAAGPDELTSVLRGIAPDVVVNAAGRAWQASEEEMLRANAEAVETLVAALTRLPSRPRLVQLGSVHEYGPGTVGTGTSEHEVPAPVTAYGRSKLRGSRAVLDGVRAGGLNGVVLRLANVCGPGAPRGSLLGAVAARLADHSASGPVELRLSPLRARRDFVDVRDVAAAVVAAADLPYPDGAKPVVNVGRGVAVPARDLVDRLIALSGVAVRIVETPEAGARRDDVQWQQLDISRARLLLGWRPLRGLDESLRDMLASGRTAVAA